MAAPKKRPDEPRERATPMAVDGRRDPVTRAGALARIDKQLGIDPETLRSSNRHPEPGSTHSHSHGCRARPSGPGPIPARRAGRDGRRPEGAAARAAASCLIRALSTGRSRGPAVNKGQHRQGTGAAPKAR